MDERKRTKREERNHTELLAELEEMEAWWRAFKLKQGTIPRDWYQLHEAAPCTPKKERLTAAFDADVVRWYRGLGRGYQARMNAVLRSYMLACLAKEIERPGDRDEAGRPI
jgi:uncharacterized protein (DUF4415 family)